MDEVINPLFIVRDKNVIVNGLGKNKIKVDFGPACTQIEKNDNFLRFKINVDIVKSKELYSNSWAKSKITFDDFLCGLLLHECSHIRYDSFGIDNVSVCNGHKANELLRYIVNILEDSRIEYRLTLEHPHYSIYLSYVLRSIKHEFYIKDKSIKDVIEKNLRDFYELARFGAIDENADKEFINFVLPLILSSNRGNLKNMFVCAQAVYFYLFSLYKESGVCLPIKIKQFQCKSKAGDYNFFEQIMSNDVYRTVSAEQKSKSGDGAQEVIKKSDLSRNSVSFDQNKKLELEEKNNQFYKSTVEKYYELIAKLRLMFKKHFYSIKSSEAPDGDINILKQQDAYLNSIINQSSNDYLKTWKEIQDIDLVILRDVSGSTSKICVEYAEATVCLLASLEGLDHVRTSLVDFSDNHVIVKGFSNKLKESLISPRFTGGTSLTSSLNALFNFNWKAKNKIVYIITDGMIDDYQHAKHLMKKLNLQYKIKFQNIDLRSVNAPTFEADKVICNLWHLPNVIIKFLIGGVKP